jgi:hypothetical protein
MGINYVSMKTYVSMCQKKSMCPVVNKNNKKRIKLSSLAAQTLPTI